MECQDLVILDLMMPGVSGVEVAELFKERRPECTIIGMTGFKNTPEEQAFLAAGAKVCLYKPIDLEEMFVALDLQEENLLKNNEYEGTKATSREEITAAPTT